MTGSIQDKFDELEKIWKRETEYVSSVSRKVAHPAYLKIIAMGKQVVPCILESMESCPDHWFYALAALTDVSPGPYSSFDEAVQFWLAWGRKEGLRDAASNELLSRMRHRAAIALLRSGWRSLSVTAVLGMQVSELEKIEEEIRSVWA